MEPTLDEVKKAMEVVRDLFDNDLYSAITYRNSKDHSELGWYEWYRQYRNYYSERGIEFYHGETKLGIDWYQLPHWIIKIGFVRSTSDWYKKNGRDCSFDFCEREWENYQEAEARGLGRYFAATYKIGCINDIGIFLQEKVRVDEEYFQDYFRTYVDEAGIVRRDDFTDNDWSSAEEQYQYAVEDYANDLSDDERIYAVYGYDGDSMDLVDFVDDHNINDLHSQNFGVNAAGQSVIFDISGFC